MPQYLGNILILLILVGRIAAQQQIPDVNIFDALVNLSVNKESESMDSIIFVGGTGVGKSTLVNMLSGIKLTVETSEIGDKQYTIDQKDESAYSTKIGHTAASQTTLPKFVPSQTDKKIALYDTSGFSQNRGYKIEVINHFGMELLFNMTQKVKVILVIDELGLRNNKLKQLVLNLGLSDYFTNSIGLIVTKVKEETTQGQLHKLLEVSISELNDRRLKGVGIVKNAYVLNNYAVFSTPERINEMRTTLQKQKQKIIKMIDKMSYATSNYMKKIITIPQGYIMYKKIEAVKKVVQKEYLDKCIAKLTTALCQSAQFHQINNESTLEDVERVLSQSKQAFSLNYNNHKEFFHYLDHKTQTKSLYQKFRTKIYKEVRESIKHWNGRKTKGKVKKHNIMDDIIGYFWS